MMPGGWLTMKLDKNMEQIPEIPLIAAPRSAEAQAALGFEWADPKVGTRHKLGGTPDWLQGDDTPKCECGKKMNFYGQLDSIGDQFSLADVGMIYVFVCPDCWTTKSLLQCG